LYQNPETLHPDFILHSISPSTVNYGIYVFLDYNFGNLRQERTLVEHANAYVEIPTLTHLYESVFIGTPHHEIVEPV
jgi:hypothetical protein